MKERMVELLLRAELEKVYRAFLNLEAMATWL
jgi:hypothetical protein